MITINTQTNFQHHAPNRYRQAKRNRRYIPPHKIHDTTVTTSTQFLVHNIHKESTNFIQANKKNLKNFFEDRIPKEINLSKEKPISFSPTRILQFRKQQDLKQSATKLNLKKSMNLRDHSKNELKKMNETFSVSSMYKKQKTSKNKFNIELHESDTSPALFKSYQTATHSSHLKRSETAKKKVYVSVFGKDQNETSIKLIGEKKQNSKSSELQRKIKLMQKKTQKMGKDKEKFRELLTKIEQYSSQLSTQKNPEDEEKTAQITRQNTQSDSESKYLLQSAMVTGIQQISVGYKKRTGKLTMKKVVEIEDMEVDFVKKLKKHKESRLRVRNQNITEVTMNEEHQLQIEVDRNYQKVKVGGIKKQTVSEEEENLQALLTITDRNKQTINEPECVLTQLNARKYTIKQKLLRFSDKMVKTNHDALMFGIPKQKLYAVLWKIRQPFELEGSYAFFKFVKNGNLSIVQNFVSQNPEYAYQVDNEGRTALIYAVQNNQIEIAKYLVGLGFNLNKETLGGTTALYYAVKTNNYEMVEFLLQNGASPWSSKKYSLKYMLELCCKEINVAMRNARKILLACELCYRFSEKFKIWESKRKLINGKQIIRFE